MFAEYNVLYVSNFPMIFRDCSENSSVYMASNLSLEGNYEQEKEMLMFLVMQFR